MTLKHDRSEPLSTTVDFQRSNCGLQRGRGQVGVLVLELAVEGEAPLVLVVGEERDETVDLVQRRPGAEREALPGKQRWMR